MLAFMAGSWVGMLSSPTAAVTAPRPEVSPISPAALPFSGHRCLAGVGEGQYPKPAVKCPGMDPPELKLRGAAGLIPLHRPVKIHNALRWGSREEWRPGVCPRCPRSPTARRSSLRQRWRPRQQTANGDKPLWPAWASIIWDGKRVLSHALPCKKKHWFCYL